MQERWAHRSLQPPGAHRGACMGGLLPKIKALQLGSLGQPGGVGTCVPEHCILLLSLPPVSALQSELNAELGVGVKAAFEAQAAAQGHTGTERIYVNADWLASGAGDAAISPVLLEESGHAIDQL